MPIKPSQARGLVIAAPASGSGKTLVTLGLLRYLRNKGLQVASAKAGPDYIDPRFHAAATGRDCPNLDPWAMRPALLRRLAAELAGEAELLLVEGVMGLFDGAHDGTGSTADLAESLALPVLLVVDAKAQAQSVVALVEGFASHRAGCRVAGVILNRIGSPRHEDLLLSALQPSGVPVVGAIRQDPCLAVPARHLGLVQAEETENLEGLLEAASERVGAAIDVGSLTDLAAPLDLDAAPNPLSLPPFGQRIAVAQDAAFAFAYPHLLAGWRAAGAELLPFSPLDDEAPDEAADAVFLPGGYPELYAGVLAGNNCFLDGLRGSVRRGARIYGECGGYMVLGAGLVDVTGCRHAMAGLLPLETSFAKRRLHLGYREITCLGGMDWPHQLRGHEFHYATVLREGEAEPLFVAADSAGEDLGPQGLRVGNVMGSFVHVIDLRH